MDSKKLLPSLIVPVVAYISLAVISFLATSMQAGFSGSNSAQALVLGTIWVILRPVSYLLAAWATLKYGLVSVKKFSLGKGDIALGAVLLGIFATILFVPAYVLSEQKTIIGAEALVPWAVGLVIISLILSIAGSIWGSGEKVTEEGAV
jgi:energy-converting hydrogenase Eha subunit C